jgi:hypothetical protein
MSLFVAIHLSAFRQGMGNKPIKGKINSNEKEDNIMLNCNSKLEHSC